MKRVKKHIICLLSLVVMAFGVNAQSKKELLDKVTILDSALTFTKVEQEKLKISLDSSILNNDSIQRELDVYLDMYKVIQERDLGAIIDSLQDVKHSSFAKMMSASEVLRDTISALGININSLNVKIDSQQVEITNLNLQVEKLAAPLEKISDEQV